MPNQTTQSIIVSAPLGQVYQIWANFENFPSFMEHVKSVTKIGDRLSHWVVDGPLGAKVEWDAETTTLEENTRVAWNSRAGSPVTTSGQVTFKELGTNQTEITVTLQYEPPAGVVGDVVAKLFSNPETMLADDLKRFKQYAEGGSRAVNE